MRRIILFLAAVVLIFAGCEKEKQPTDDVIVKLENWKLKKGDDLAWAKAETNVSDWQDISPNNLWERQGLKSYDGYAWYRISFELPEAMKSAAHFKDTIQFDLGKIDDTDQTFLNGQLIGQNGEIVEPGTEPGKFENDPEAYNIYRRYKIPAKDERLKWGQENVLAIRVHDHGGGGGLYTVETPCVSMVDVKDYLAFQLNVDFFEVESDIIRKAIEIKETSEKYDFGGTLKIKITDLKTGELVHESSQQLSLVEEKPEKVTYEFEANSEKPYKATYTFTDKASGKSLSASEETPFILTPEPPAKPRVNGPVVFGVSPGAPFLYLIPATGERPMTFSVNNLPAGLNVDAEKGIITGKIEKAGDYPVTFIAENSKGTDSLEFTIKVGDEICLTPPLGWNSWNCWGLSVTAEQIEQAAKSMVESGLSQHGWTYINIDDGWEAPERTEDGILKGNKKFPDMKQLADNVHAMGLKIGLYSSPGPETCGGYLGSYQHEEIDAKTWAEWGYDYIKYDWCSYRDIAKDQSLEELQKPYIVMNEALNKVDRDIVYSLCQYGMGNVWEWGADVGGNLWRTTGDIVDTWRSMSTIGFAQDNNAQYAGPGHWNDPDMLVVGWVGWGPNLHPTRLTPSEQYTHISLWALLSAPLLLGNDMSRMDDFTINLLTNDEVLAINQDPLGNQAVPVVKNNDSQIWMKKLSDGSIAVGIFNMTTEYKKFTANWSDLNIEGKQVVRDVWRQKDLGEFDSDFESEVLPHGVVLIKITPKQ